MASIEISAASGAVAETDSAPFVQTEQMTRSEWVLGKHCAAHVEMSGCCFKTKFVQTMLLKHCRAPRRTNTLQYAHHLTSNIMPLTIERHSHPNRLYERLKSLLLCKLLF
jgi:hypothetical protein